MDYGPLCLIWTEQNKKIEFIDYTTVIVISSTREKELVCFVTKLKVNENIGKIRNVIDKDYPMLKNTKNYHFVRDHSLVEDAALIEGMGGYKIFAGHIIVLGLIDCRENTPLTRFIFSNAQDILQGVNTQWSEHKIIHRIHSDP